MMDVNKLKTITKESKAKTILAERFQEIERKANELKKGRIVHVPLAELEENPYQPRLQIDENELKELIESIKENGLLQPILIAKQNNGKYYILAGHRRTEAYKRLNKETIEAILIEDKNTEKELASIAMIENIQRVQLNPIEEAILYKRMIDSNLFNSIREMAKKLGKDHGSISKKINLLKLNSKIIEDITQNKTTKDVTGLAMINSFTKDKDIQWSLYQILIKEGRDTLKETIKNMKEENLNIMPEKNKWIDIKKTKKSVQIKIKQQIDDQTLKIIEQTIEELLKKRKSN